MKWPIWKWGGGDAAPEEKKKQRRPPSGANDDRKSVVVFVDDSAHSRSAFDWTLRHVLRPEKDSLHIVSIATPPPFGSEPMPTVGAGVEGLLTEEAADDIARIGREHRERAAASFKGVQKHLAEAAASRGMDKARIHCGVLHGEMAGVQGAMAVQYADEHAADLAVFGSRGMGQLRRAVMSAIGLGSVSDYAVRHMPCATLVCPAREMVDAPPTKKPVATPEGNGSEGPQTAAGGAGEGGRAGRANHNAENLASVIL